MEEKNEFLTYEKISSVYRNVYIMSGFIPYERNYEDPHYWRNAIKYYCFLFYFHVTSALMSSMYLGHGIRMILQHQPIAIDYVCETLIIFNTYIRFIMLNVKRQKLLVLMKFCENLWSHLRDEERDNIRPFERKVYYMKNVFMWGTITSSSMYLLTAQIIRIPPADANGTATRILPAKFYVDVQEEPWYTLASILQTGVCYSYAVTLSCIECVGPFFVMMSCGYLRAIQNRLVDMTEENDENLKSCKTNDNDRLSTSKVLECVKFHQQIMEFYEDVERFMRSLFMIQISCSVYNTSLIGIKLLQNEKEQLRYCGILFLNLFQFFTCQWIPEYLLTEGKMLANTAYSATMSHKSFERKANIMLLFIMIRSEKPLQLTAGGYIKLSLESFQRMFTSAYSLFTVLRNFN